jgi:NADH-quinone oxidoreductase subunit N
MSEEIIRALVNVFPQVIPVMVLGVFACVLFLGSTFRADRHIWAGVALVGLAGAAVALVWMVPTVPLKRDPNYASPIAMDRLALLIHWMALVGGSVLVLFSWNEVPDRQAGEYHGCLLLVVAGLCLTSAANELVTLFLSLELISIPTYILMYLPRHDAAAQEAAMKYFLLSIFSSALLLFGFSYLYGLGGTTNLPALLEALTRNDTSLPVVALVSLILVVAGFGFKITAVPFHFYAPDVYQGAPTGAVALLAFLPKVAGFVALFRVLGLVFTESPGNGMGLGDHVSILFWILAAVTMSLGNVLALLQTNVKRLLAYSSVAHAGYMLIGLAVAEPLHKSQILSPQSELLNPRFAGVDAVLFYLVAYGAMTIGAFAVLAYLSTAERPIENEDDLSGLSQSHPGVALLMALFLFSLIGIPLTAGFAGKLVLFLDAMAVEGDNAHLFRGLALVGVINAAIGAWYYLRILTKMYLHSSIKPIEKPRALPGLLALWICAAVTLGLGVFPGLMLRSPELPLGAKPATSQMKTSGRPDPPKTAPPWRAAVSATTSVIA